MNVNRMDTIAQKATASLTQWPWVLVLLVLGGALLYIAYRYRYDKNLNAALLDKAVRKLPSPKTVLFGYAISAAACSLLVFAWNTQPGDMKQRSCFTTESYLDLNTDEQTITEELKHMETLKSRESVSYHEQELKHGIRMQYAIKNKKDYVYIISYERAATDLKEYYYIELQDIFGGTYATNMIMNPKDKKLYVMVRGTMQESCDASELKLELRNITEEENKNPIHEEIRFTVENGGIQNESK